MMNSSFMSFKLLRWMQKVKRTIRLSMIWWVAQFDKYINQSQHCTSSTRDSGYFRLLYRCGWTLIRRFSLYLSDIPSESAQLVLGTLRVSYGFPVKPELDLLRMHASETAETQYQTLDVTQLTLLNRDKEQAMKGEQDKSRISENVDQIRDVRVVDQRQLHISVLITMQQGIIYDQLRTRSWRIWIIFVMLPQYQYYNNVLSRFLVSRISTSGFIHA